MQCSTPKLHDIKYYAHDMPVNIGTASNMQLTTSSHNWRDFPPPQLPNFWSIPCQTSQNFPVFKASGHSACLPTLGTGGHWQNGKNLTSQQIPEAMAIIPNLTECTSKCSHLSFSVDWLSTTSRKQAHTISICASRTETIRQPNKLTCGYSSSQYPTECFFSSCSNTNFRQHIR